MRIFPKWQSLCASSIGSAHKKNDIPLQDYGVGATYPLPAMIIADGAGSAANSATGAESAVKTSLEFIGRNKLKIDSQEKCEKLLDVVVTQLKQKAQKLGAEVPSLATTLIIVYVLDKTIYWIQIGDGMIVARKNGVLGCVSFPRHGEFANETVFVTSKKASDSIQYGTFPVSSCDGIITFTDGLNPFLIHKNEMVPAQVCSSLIEQLKEKSMGVDDLENLLNNQLSDASDDDKTLGILVPCSRKKVIRMKLLSIKRVLRMRIQDVFLLCLKKANAVLERIIARMEVRGATR